MTMVGQVALQVIELNHDDNNQGPIESTYSPHFWEFTITVYNAKATSLS